MKKYNDRDKINAVSILCKAANLYEQYFCNKKLLVIHNNLSQPFCTEISATPAGFMHLTGLKVNEANLLNDISDTDANYRVVFYEKCLHKRITINDFDFDSKSDAELKLKVILNALTPKNSAKMLGDYNGQRLYFKSDKLMGSESSYLGLFKDKKGYYAVGSVINGDIRNDVEHIGASPITSKIFLILSKNFSDDCYNEIICAFKHKGKMIDVPDLLGKISKEYAISPELLLPSAPEDPTLNGEIVTTKPDPQQQNETTEIAHNNISEIPQSQGSQPKPEKKRMSLDERLAKARSDREPQPTQTQSHEQTRTKKNDVLE